MPTWSNGLPPLLPSRLRVYRGRARPDPHRGRPLQGPARARARARGPVLVGRDGARRAAGGGTRRRRVSGGRLMTGLGRHRQDWDDLAALDPYWSVLTEPRNRFGGWDRQEFLRSGETEIEGLMVAARELGLPHAHEAALDFGCGLGRLTRSLARYFGQVWGVDISARMVQQARELHRDRPNCTFQTTDGTLAFPDARFDLIYSVLVLQHQPTRAAIRATVRELVRTLRTGGLLCFQLSEPAAAATAVAAPASPLRRAAHCRPRGAAALRALLASSHPHERGRRGGSPDDRGRGRWSRARRPPGRSRRAGNGEPSLLRYPDGIAEVRPQISTTAGPP
jgi:SAM-dependent methyltransferase